MEAATRGLHRATELTIHQKPLVQGDDASLPQDVSLCEEQMFFAAKDT